MQVDGGAAPKKIAYIRLCSVSQSNMLEGPPEADTRNRGTSRDRNSEARPYHSEGTPKKKQKTCKEISE